MWRRVSLISSRRWQCNRWFSTEIPRRGLHPIEDEGDWSAYSSEWWETTPESHTVLRSTSHKGNGIISVVSHPCSKPDAVQWATTERWLRQRYSEIHPEDEHNGDFRVLGYQWRVLHFNDFTRQSTVKVMAACRRSDPSSVSVMQQPHILAVPYLKSLISVGLTTLASCNYDLRNAVRGEKPMHIMCIGLGGGSLPLFLASKIHGAIVHAVEIDPLVISTAMDAMGFPSFTRVNPSGKRTQPHPTTIDQVFWKGTHERLFTYEADAEDFILKTTTTYDLVLIDAYDGDDIFPHKLWDPDGAFLKSLSTRLHPEHGTVVVNLHSDWDESEDVLPMSKYVGGVCEAYKEMLVGKGLGYVVSVPWLCNSSLVVCRGLEGSGGRDLILSRLLSKAREVEDALELPFSCLEYIKEGFVLTE